jgi:hypothetical protein
MPTVTPVAKTRAAKEEALNKASAAGARTLAGGLSLPEGKHSLLTADKNTFGILNVDSKTSGKWALPIVAGVVTCADGAKVEFVLSDKPGAKTLVIADNFFMEMQSNQPYIITVGKSANGRKVVTSVIPADAIAEGSEAEPAKEEAEY